MILANARHQEAEQSLSGFLSIGNIFEKKNLSKLTRFHCDFDLNSWLSLSIYIATSIEC